MKTHYLKNLDYKYIKGIEDGQISLLIFTKQKIHDVNSGDILQIITSRLTDNLEVVILKTEYKSFEELTEKEAKKAGFSNKDFLKDELLRTNDFDIITKFDELKDVILFLVTITKKEDCESLKTEDKRILNDDYTCTMSYPFVDIFDKYKNRTFYWSEYDENV